MILSQVGRGRMGFVLVAMFGVTIMMAGCTPGSVAQQGSETQQSSQVETVTQTEQPETEPEQPIIVETAQTSNHDEKAYFGNWMIDSVKGTSAVYALSREEMDAFMGTNVMYQEDAYSWNGSHMAVQGYEESEVSEETFAADFGIPLSGLGVAHDKVTSVMMMAEGNYFGGYFYILDENTLMIYHEGVFFEAVRSE